MESEHREEKANDSDFPEDDLQAQATALGIPYAMVSATLDEEEQRAAEAERVIEVWETAVPILNLWSEVGHLWIYGAMGGRIGLRWESIKARIELMERGCPEIPAEHIDGLAVLERALLQNSFGQKTKSRT